jgi:ribosome-associated protein
VEHETVDSEAASARQADRARQRAMAAARAAEENRGRNIVVLDMRELTPIFDYFVLVTGASRRQLHAISEEVSHALKGMGDRRRGMEGYEDSHWILLDFGDVVVHLFDAETRQYYALEDLWAQAKRVPFEPRLSEPPAKPLEAKVPDALPTEAEPPDADLPEAE